MCSIFATAEEAKEWGRRMRKLGHRVGTPRRPLADATMARIARGVKRFILDSADPFIVPIQNYGWGDTNAPLDEPLRTITAHPSGGGFGLVSPVVVPNNAHNLPHGLDGPVPTVTGGNRNMLVAATLAQTGYGERDGQAPRALDIDEPLGTIMGTGQKHALVAAYLAKHFTGVDGADLREPAPTVTSIDHTSLVTAHLTAFQSGEPAGGQRLDDPLRTILAKPKVGLVAAFIQAYYGEGVGQSPAEPLRTITSKDRLALVTVMVQGQPYVIVDILLRMLQPRELFRAQSFPDSYEISRGADGKRLTKTVQVRLVGNSVPPVEAAAIVAANCPELVARDEVLEGVA